MGAALDRLREKYGTAPTPAAPKSGSVRERLREKYLSAPKESQPDQQSQEDAIARQLLGRAGRSIDAGPQESAGRPRGHRPPVRAETLNAQPETAPEDVGFLEGLARNTAATFASGGNLGMRSALELARQGAEVRRAPQAAARLVQRASELPPEQTKARSRFRGNRAPVEIGPPTDATEQAFESIREGLVEDKRSIDSAFTDQMRAGRARISESDNPLLAIIQDPAAALTMAGESGVQMAMGGPLAKFGLKAAQLAEAGMAAGLSGDQIREHFDDPRVLAELRADPVFQQRAQLVGEQEALQQTANAAAFTASTITAGSTYGIGRAASRAGLDTVNQQAAGIRGASSPRLAGRLGEYGREVAGEFGTEMLQGGAEQVAQNIALGDPLTEGVGKASLLEGSLGAATAAGTSLPTLRNRFAEDLEAEIGDFDPRAAEVEARASLTPERFTRTPPTGDPDIDAGIGMVEDVLSKGVGDVRATALDRRAGQPADQQYPIDPIIQGDDSRIGDERNADRGLRPQAGGSRTLPNQPIAPSSDESQDAELDRLLAAYESEPESDLVQSDAGLSQGVPAAERQVPDVAGDADAPKFGADLDAFAKQTAAWVAEQRARGAEPTVSAPTVRQQPVADGRRENPEGLDRETRELIAGLPRDAGLNERETADLPTVEQEIGWDQRGGGIIRDNEGKVSGRMTWIPKPGTIGGLSNFWSSRPDPINEDQAKVALRKAQAGEKLTKREARFVEHARAYMREIEEYGTAERELSKELDREPKTFVTDSGEEILYSRARAKGESNGTSGWDASFEDNAGRLGGDSQGSDGAPNTAGIEVSDADLSPEELARYFGNARQSAASAGADADTVADAARQWREKGTESPYFKQWFGKSQATRKGKPLVVYHGTSKEFHEFQDRSGSASGRPASGLGIFTTDNPVIAETYGDRTMPMYAKVENPYRMSEAEISAFESVEESVARRKELQRQGYDGIWIPHMGAVVVFKSNQLKSTGNRGTFDGNDPDIRRSQASSYEGPTMDEINALNGVETTEIMAEAVAAVGADKFREMVGKRLSEPNSKGFPRELLIEATARSVVALARRNARKSAGRSAPTNHIADAGKKVESIRAAASKAWGDRLIKRLEFNGILNFITAAQAKRITRGGYRDGDKGFAVTRDGKTKTYIIVDNITPDQVPGLILHEVGTHFGLEAMLERELGPGAFAKLKAEMRKLRKTDRDVQAAYAAVPNDTAEDVVDEEAIAYLSEQNPGHGLIQRILDAVRGFLRKLGVPSAWIESRTGEILRMVRDSLRASGKGAKQASASASTAPQPIRGSFAGPRAKTANIGTLEQAKAALKSGQDAEAVRKATDQTETENFRNWFKDSKVVDAKGKPLVVYHGTGRGDVVQFKQGVAKGAGGRSARLGFFFTASPAVASSYAEETVEFERTRGYEKAYRLELRGDFDAAERLNEELESTEFTGGMTPNVMPVYLSMQNPLVVDFAGREYNADTDNLSADIARAKAAGHDGVIFRNIDDAPRRGFAPADQLVVFKDTQIKSAIGNDGTFGPTGDIRYSRKTLQVAPRGLPAMPAIESYAENLVRLRAFWDSASDVLRRQPGLAKLGNAIDSYFDNMRRRKGIVNALLRGPVKAATAEDLKAFTKYQAAVQNKRQAEAVQIRQSMSPTGQALVLAWAKVADVTNQHNQAVGIKVQDPKIGGWRKIGSARNFFPRVLQEKYQRAMGQPHKYPVEWNEMVDALLASGHIASEAEAEKYLSDYFSPESSQDYFAGIEKARGEPLPESLYDYSIDTALGYKDSWADRLSQVEAFGQVTGPGTRDMFGDVSASTLDKRTQEYIDRVRDRVGQVNPKDPLHKTLATLNTIATGLHLGNPLSAMKNLIGGLSINLQSFPLAANIRAFKELRHLGQGIRDAVAKGVLIEDFMGIATDAVSMGVNEVIAKATTFALKWGGFTGVESINRVHSMLVGKHYLADSIKEWNKRPRSTKSKQALAWFQRNRIDTDKLLAEVGQTEQPETDKFLRLASNITQGSYQIDQTPVFVDTPIGKFLFKYQKFSNQINRVFWQGMLKPFFQSVFKGGVPVTYKDVNGAEVKERVRTFMPLVRFLAMAVPGGLLMQQIAVMAFGAGEDGPDEDEIKRKLADGETAAGLALMAQRAWYAIMANGSMGFVGNYAQTINDIRERQRYKNPLDPPGLAPLKSIFDLILKAWDQQTLTTQDIVDEVNKNVSWVRATTRLAASGLNALGIDAHFAKVETARRDFNHVRYMARRYASDVGIAAKRRAPESIGATENTPANRAIKDALLLGDSETARALAAEHIADAESLYEAQNRLASIKASIRMGQPAIVSTSPSEGERVRFLQWAKSNLTAEGYQRITRADEAYRNASRRSGLWKPNDSAAAKKRSATSEESKKPARPEQINAFLRKHGLKRPPP